jgi:hypothetical protein
MAYFGDGSDMSGIQQGLLASIGAKVTKTILLTTTGASTWTVPADWTDAGSTIRVIGGGGSGARLGATTFNLG